MDFPASPTIGQRYTFGGKTWEYNGEGWALVAGGATATPGGSSTQIQYNDGGILGGDADFTWDKTNNILTLAGGEVRQTGNIRFKPTSSATTSLIIEPTHSQNTSSLTARAYDFVQGGSGSSTGDGHSISISGTGGAPSNYLHVNKIGTGTYAIYKSIAIGWGPATGLVSNGTAIYMEADTATGALTQVVIGGNTKDFSGAKLLVSGALNVTGSILSNGTNISTIYASSGHTHSLNSLTNVNITSPSATQVLQYNGTTWVNATPPGVTDLSWTASTRTIASSTGADAVLSLFSPTEPGLTPASGGGTSNFLRADGTWTTPAATGQTNIQFQDEGSNLGTAGTVDTLDFTGSNLTASRVGNKVTVAFTGAIGSGITYTYAATAPVSPNPGDEWVDSTAGILYKFISDGNTTQWVDFSGSGAPVFTSSLPGIVPASGGGTSNFLRADGTWVAPAGTGTVTSVGLSLPAIFSVTNSPVTTTGTLTGTLASQLQNLVFASPNGSSGVPTFRALAAADLPTVTETKGGTGQTTYATGDILYASGANTLAKLPAGTNTHVLTLVGGVPTWAAPTGGGGGTSGYSGISGYSGVGTSGFSGYSGAAGATGSTGTSGYSGYSGVGTSGYSGYSGAGTSGFSGYSGVGTSGYSGYSGVGTSGYSGAVGFSGYSGASGGGGNPGGSNKQIQYNNSAAFGGVAGFEWDSATTTLSLASAAARTPAVTVTYGATTTIDCRVGQIFRVALTGNISTLTINNAADGQTINVLFVQDATGGRTVVWPASFVWVGQPAPLLSTTANYIDVLTATYSSTDSKWLCTLAVQNSAASFVSLPGGSNTQVQFNDSGTLNGSSALTINKTTGTVAMTPLTGQALSVTQLAGQSGVTIYRSADAESTEVQFQVGFSGQRSIAMNARLGNANYNPTVTAGDSTIFATAASMGSGVLNLTVHSATSVGIRMTGAGAISINGSTTHTGAFTVSSTLTAQAAASVAGMLTVSSSAAGTTGSIYLSNATNNQIYFIASGVSAPTFTTRSAGTKLMLYPALTGSAVDYAIGIESSTLWFSKPTAATETFKWYGGTTLEMSLQNGTLTLPLAGSRLRGDMSTATLANRLFAQTSTTNGNTDWGVIPNGSGTTAGILAFNNSTPTNAGYLTYAINTTAAFIQSGKSGSGTALNLQFQSDAAVTATMFQNGNWNIGTTTSDPGVKLRVEGTTDFTGLVTVSGGQIKFPAAQAASTDVNTLDDYEEGTWTPTDASGASLSLTVDNAKYVKVGKLVTITLGSISWPSTASTADAKIGGLPFTSATGGTTHTGGVFAFASPYPGSNYAPVPVLLYPNTTELRVFDPVNGVGMQNVALSTTALYGLSLTYIATA